MLPIEIINFMKEYSISYTVIVNLENQSIDTYGDINSLPYKKLVESLFGNTDCVINLYKNNVGQTMPQSWRQGNTKCVVCIPRTNTIVGLFYIEHRDAVQSYNWAKKLNSNLFEIF